MPRVDPLDAVTDDRRAAHLYDTKAAADAVGCHPNKFSDWWTRTEGKLQRLAARQPRALSAHLIAILARAYDEPAADGRIDRDQRPPTPRPRPGESHHARDNY